MVPRVPSRRTRRRRAERRIGEWSCTNCNNGRSGGPADGRSEGTPAARRVVGTSQIVFGFPETLSHRHELSLAVARCRDRPLDRPTARPPDRPNTPLPGDGLLPDDLRRRPGALPRWPARGVHGDDGRRRQGPPPHRDLDGADRWLRAAVPLYEPLVRSGRADLVAG